MVREAVHTVSDAVVADISQQEDILASDGIVQNGFALSCAETWALHLHQIVFFHIAVEGRIVFHVVLQIAGLFHKMAVYLFCQGKRRLWGEKLHGSYRHRMFKLFCIRHLYSNFCLCQE